ncbi:type I polyketide synthase, partial [Streptomyces sp. NPDC090445]|uniref:type I polyketide synthase n=1 Tax=Streptomyces sp. NPDC090445 TaxID=3365963 RepID=UPI00382ABBD6
PDGRGTLWTGRLSTAEHPWLADHTLYGQAVLPPSVLVEYAFRAGDHVKCPHLEDLDCHLPLVLPIGDAAPAVSVQVLVSAADEDGRRAVEIFSRPGDAADDAEWTLHASGTLAPTRGAGNAGDAVNGVRVEAWPPAGATPLRLEDVFEHLARAQVGFGPAVRTVRAAWRRGEELFAEVALPAGANDHTTGFALRPGLLDAVLHITGDPAAGEARLPSAWTGAELFGVGASTVRIHVTPADQDGGLTVRVTDESGAPVLSVGRLVTRPVQREQLRAMSGGVRDALFDLVWEPATSVVGPPARRVTWGSPEAADTVIWAVDDDRADEVSQTAARALSVVQEFVSGERFAGSRLVLLTRGAVAVSSQEGAPALGAASVWGLVRSAQREHPGRLVVVDVEPGLSADAEAAALGLALGVGESQVAVRGGRVVVPRLARVGEVPVGRSEGSFGPSGTVLVTGGTGGLGALVARHLVSAYGVRDLLLVSRRGAAADGVEVLVEELAGVGARVRVEACDVGDRTALAVLLDSIPADRPLTGVVHCAGVVDDGVLESLTPDRLTGVLRPKAEAALHLHELTAGLDLTAFVLFSSVAGIFGAPGRAPYSAANAVLDALAQQRRAQRLPALSAAWGLWEEERGMGGQVTGADLARLRREGAVPMSAEEALALFDAVLLRDRPLSVPARLDLAELGGADAPPLPVLRRLVPPARRRLDTGDRQEQAPANAAEELGRRLAGLPDGEQVRTLLGLVRDHAAGVLGHTDPMAVSPDRGFLESGFTSVAVVELRNRLSRATGVRFSAATLFDNPSPRAVARHIQAELAEITGGNAAAGTGTGAGTADAEFRAALSTLPLSRLKEVGVLDALLRLTGFDGALGAALLAQTAGQQDPKGPAGTADAAAVTPESIDAMDLDSLVHMAINTDA